MIPQNREKFSVFGLDYSVKHKRVVIFLIKNDISFFQPLMTIRLKFDTVSTLF